MVTLVDDFEHTFYIYVAFHFGHQPARNMKYAIHPITDLCTQETTSS